MQTARARIHDFVPNPYAVKQLPRNKKLTVLLVEDDDAYAYLIKNALSRNPRIGNVLHAMDGVEALDLIDNYETRPDLAIVDLKMPRKDGLTLLSDFSFRQFAQFPAIVLTSSTSRHDFIFSYYRGAVECMTKRDSPDEMAQELDQLIDKLTNASGPAVFNPKANWFEDPQSMRVRAMSLFDPRSLLGSLLALFRGR